MLSRSWPLTILFAISLAMSGCASDTTSGGTTGSDASETALDTTETGQDTPESGGETFGEKDTNEEGGDDATPDATETGEESGDIPDVNAEAGEDAEETETTGEEDAGTETGDATDTGEETGGPDCTPGAAQFGCPCSGNNDCESLYCLPLPEGFICTAPCEDDCPEGFQCEAVTDMGVELLYLCVPLDIGEESGDTETGDDTAGDAETGDETGDETAEDAEAGEEDEEGGESTHEPPVFACTKDGDCMLQFPDLPACQLAQCDLVTGDCGVVTLADDTLCSDGDPCSLDDTCQEGACVSAKLNCNDDNLCTDDVCFPGLGCVNEKNLNFCDDEDSCTLWDQCHDNECQGDPISCNDQDGCTNDFCIDGECVHQVIQAEECCFVDVSSWQFTDGTTQGWIAEGTDDTVGWTVSDLRFSSASHALYYGDIDTLSYAGAGANSGVITSQPSLLPSAGLLTFSFQLYLDVESAAGKDKLYVYLLHEDGTTENLWHKTSATPLKAWHENQIDLSEHAGKVIQIQFSFDTIDGTANGTEGVYIDDVYLFSACPQEPCLNALDCDDGNPCTADDCGEGLCSHQLVEDCCISDFQCEDGDVCTTDDCEGWVCVSAVNEKPCNDGDACTIMDTCADGACGGVDLSCDDYESCTLDACVEGVCNYAPSGDTICCNLDTASWSFDPTETPEGLEEPTGWNMDASGEIAPVPGTTTIPWEYSHARASSFPQSIHVGPSTAGPDLSGPALAVTEGPLVPVSLSEHLELRFWLYADVVPIPGADILEIHGISPEGKDVLLWEKPEGISLKQWTFIKADASFFIQEGGVKLRIIYSSGAPMNLDNEGFYLDDIHLHIPCEAPCTSALDCDDQDSSTDDACVEGVCKHTPLLWYCEENTDCEDWKLCTESLCAASTCQIFVVPGCCESDSSCLDENPCTTDLCGGLSGCTHEDNTLPCDDADGCTELDVCGSGVCAGAPVDCDDGTGCSLGSCVNDDCSYEFVNNPGCCDKNEETYDFTSPLGATGWSVESTKASVTWQTSSAKYTSGPSALYYGNVSAQNYDLGKNSGSATSPKVWLPNAVVTSAKFLLYLDVEDDPEFDTLTISAVTGEGDDESVTVLWTKPAAWAMQEFTQMILSLDGWQGQEVALRFSFDTVDGSANEREGVYVDDLRFHVACPLTPCATNDDCEASGACALSSCVDGLCAEETVLGCCGAEADCNDFNPCTSDLCQGGTCANTTIEGCCFSSSECEDGNACTTDICDPAVGCIHQNNTNFCSDGEPCTKNDTCQDGECSGVPLTCDDGDDQCTNDVCKSGACVYEPTGAAGCCDTDEECNDNDDCTADSCNDGICLSINLCCQSDEECDDSDDVCTVDQCLGGDCIYQNTNAPGCCTPIVYDESFPAADGSEFNFQNSQSQSKWQVTTSGKSASAPGALYYGNTGSWNFNNGASNGTATTPPIALPDKDGINLSFQVYMNTEGGTTYDQLWLYVVSGGSKSSVWNKSQYWPGGMSQWKSQTVNLSAYKGQSIQLEWFFNTIDSIGNSGEGVYIDDILITVPCP
jgi:hypothetical protein